MKSNDSIILLFLYFNVFSLMYNTDRIYNKIPVFYYLLSIIYY